MNQRLCGLLTVLTNTEHIWSVHVNSWTSFCPIKTETTEICCLLPCEGPWFAWIHIFLCWWNLPVLSLWEQWEMKNGWKAFEIVCMITIILLQWRECACHVLLHVTQRPCTIQKTLVPMSYNGWQYLLYFLPFSIDIEVLFLVRVSVFVQLRWFLFHFTSPFFLLI